MPKLPLRYKLEKVVVLVLGYPAPTIIYQIVLLIAALCVPHVGLSQVSEQTDTVITGQVVVVENNWRFVYRRDRLIPREFLHRPRIDGRFSHHFIGSYPEHQLLFFPKDFNDSAGIVSFNHDNRRAVPTRLDIDKDNFFKKGLGTGKMFHFTVPGVSERIFIEQLEDERILRIKYDHKKLALYSQELEKLPLGEKMFAAANVLANAQKYDQKQILTFNSKTSTVSYYQLSKDDSLKLIKKDKVNHSVDLNKVKIGRFAATNTLSLLLVSNDNTQVTILTPNTAADIDSIHLRNLELPSGSPLTGDFNNNGIEELLFGSADSAVLEFVEFHKNGIKRNKRFLPDKAMVATQHLVASFRHENVAELLRTDEEYRFWEVWMFDNNFKPRMSGKLDAAEVSAPRHFLLNRTQGRKNAIVVYNEDSGWAVSSFGLHTPAVSVRVSLGFEHFTTTNAWGVYKFSNLKPGKYKVQVAAPGYNFIPLSEPEIEIHNKKQRQTVNFFTQAPQYSGRKSPAICTGYNDRFHRWGYHPLKDGRLISRCANHSAVLWAQDITDFYDLTCCPLPSDDILGKKHTATTGECPDGYISTGPTVVKWGPAGYFYQMECTEINHERYQLGPETAGVYWGVGESFRGETMASSFENIPVALRYALGRTTHRRWDNDGCIGATPGFILTTVARKNCRDMRFRELQYRGIPGDPPKGTAVQIIPECKRISSPFSPDPECIK